MIGNGFLSSCEGGKNLWESGCRVLQGGRKCTFLTKKQTTSTFTETRTHSHTLLPRLLKVASDARPARSESAESERHSLALGACSAVGARARVAAHLARHIAVASGEAALERGEVLDVVEEGHAVLVDAHSQQDLGLLGSCCRSALPTPRPLGGGLGGLLRDAGELEDELVLELLEVKLRLVLVLELVGAEGIC